MFSPTPLVFKIIGCVIIFTLHSCSSTPKDNNWKIDSSEKAMTAAKSLASKHGTTVSKTSQKPRPIRIPKTATWLNHPVQAAYAGNIDAKTAILSILHNQPVRFEVSTNGPPVKANPNAKTFKQHLDAISEQANWSYRISNGVVTFSDWEVINYPIYFILGKKDINLEQSPMVSNSSEQSSNSASNTNTLSVNNNAFNELKEIMNNLIDKTPVGESSKKVPSFSIMKSTNSVLVSAPPNIQQQVKNALMTINTIAGRAIHLAFDIYSVDLSETYQKAVDIEILKQSGVNVSSKVTSDILANATNIPYLFSLDSAKGDYNSNIMLKALAKHGKASLANKGTLLLKNNEAGEIKTASLNEWKDFSVGDDFQSKSPAFKETIIQVFPSIIGEKINLHLIISDTNNEPYLQSLTREPLPQTNGINLNQPQYQIEIDLGMIKLGEQYVIPTEIKNGETLIIGGLTRTIYSDSRSKNQMLPIFGDGRDKQSRRQETIIVMTAYLLD